MLPSQENGKNQQTLLKLLGLQPISWSVHLISLQVMQLLESQGGSHLLLSSKSTSVMLVFIGGGAEHCPVKCFTGRGCLSHWPANLLGKVVSPIFCQFPDALFFDVLNLCDLVCLSGTQENSHHSVSRWFTICQEVQIHSLASCCGNGSKCVPAHFAGNIFPFFWEVSIKLGR